MQVKPQTGVLRCAGVCAGCARARLLHGARVARAAAAAAPKPAVHQRAGRRGGRSGLYAARAGHPEDTGRLRKNARPPGASRASACPAPAPAHARLRPAMHAVPAREAGHVLRNPRAGTQARAHAGTPPSTAAPMSAPKGSPFVSVPPTRLTPPPLVFCCCAFRDGGSPCLRRRTRRWSAPSRRLA